MIIHLKPHENCSLLFFFLHVIIVFNYLALGKKRKMNFFLFKFVFELLVTTLYLLLPNYLQGLFHS